MRASQRRPLLALLLCALSGWPVLAPRAEQPPLPPSEGRPAAPSTQHFDPQHTSFGFEMRTRWGQRVVGMFPQYEGEVTQLPDGRYLVRIVLHTASVVVAGSTRYTEMARGPDFFDAQRFPVIEFMSEPHTEALIRSGGRLHGRLSMHGVSRVESFQLSPAPCERPGKDCDVVANGSIDRSDYKLDGWQFVLADRVRFSMQVRAVEAAP